MGFFKCTSGKWDTQDKVASTWKENILILILQGNQPKLSPYKKIRDFIGLWQKKDPEQEYSIKKTVMIMS